VRIVDRWIVKGRGIVVGIDALPEDLVEGTRVRRVPPELRGGVIELTWRVAGIEMHAMGRAHANGQPAGLLLAGEAPLPDIGTEIEIVVGDEFRKLPYPVFCQSGVKPDRRQACPCVPEPEPCAACAEFARDMERWRSGRPWLDNGKLVPELHAGGWEHDVRVCIATDNVVEIDKLYGPLVAQPVRVSIEGESWIVERMVEEKDPEPGTSAWVVVARFPLDGEIPGTVQ
jgi:hypothetical protein